MRGKIKELLLLNKACLDIMSVEPLRNDFLKKYS